MLKTPFNVVAMTLHNHSQNRIFSSKELVMLFSSYIFIFIFLPIVWLGFHALAALSFKHAQLGFHALAALSFKHAYTLAKVFLIFSSLFFYAYWNLAYLPILLSSILITYFFATRILSTQNSSQKDSSQRNNFTQTLINHYPFLHTQSTCNTINNQYNKGGGGANKLDKKKKSN